MLFFHMVDGSWAMNSEETTTHLDFIEIIVFFSKNGNGDALIARRSNTLQINFLLTSIKENSQNTTFGMRASYQ